MRFPVCSITILFVFSSLLFPASGAYAQTTWHVDDDACPGPGSGTDSDPFCSIQTAIDAATDGDEVVVRVGSYLENINYFGKAITVRSSDPEDPDTVASTVIDGRGAQEEDTFGSVVTFNNGEASDSLLNGLTLLGGIGTKVFDNRRGGAVYVLNASPTIYNCLLTHNRARSGGGLYCIGEGADPVISNCTIRSNAARSGGGICSGAGSSPQITRCWILDNTSRLIGGALYGSGGSLTINNCVIAGNTARSGGALFLATQGAATVSNSTMVANEASVRGGAIRLNSSSATLRNCISWGNTAPDGSEFSLVAAVLSVDFCDVQGGQEAVELLYDSTLLWGVGNIDADPLFLGTQPRNEHLSVASPCVNAGDPLFTPGPDEKDIDGDERVINLIVDMGADELNPDCNGNGISDEEDIADGTSVDCNNNGVPDECLHLELDCNENALPDECDIETGDSEDSDGNGVPDECEPQVTIYVDDDAAGQPVQDGTAENPFGTIEPALNAVLVGQNRVVVVVADGIYLGDGNKNLDFGGKIFTLRSVHGPQATIIDCQGAGRGFTFINGETRDAILDGFTIKNGRAHDGGAIQCKYPSNPTIRNCMFIENVSEGIGRGGALNISQGAPFVTHCTFIGNTAEGSGRGGGAIFALTGLIPELPSIHNCLFVGNTAYRGGGIWSAGPLDVRNCIIARNTAADQGGGLYLRSDHPYVFSNCILWGDEAALGSEVYLKDETTTLTLRYTDVQGGQAGVDGLGTLIWEAGNIDADPLFVDADQGNYRLLSGSPAIDAGDSTAVPPDVSDLDGDGDTSEPIPFDLDGQPRFLNDLDTPDTGNPDGVHAIVDMGPYELGQPGCPDLDDDGQVTICHTPPGNPDNAHTITANANAVAAHLGHGDHCGPCAGDEESGPFCPPQVAYPQPLNSDAADDEWADTHPQLATDRQGNWVAVWRAWDYPDDPEIRFSRSADDGITWTEPEFLNTNAGTDSANDESPYLATDAQGNWLVVWHSNHDFDGTIGDDYDILFARSTDSGASWSDPQPLNTNAGIDSEDDYAPQVAGDGTGIWVAVWHSKDDLGETIGPDDDILFSRSSDGGISWTDPAPVDPDAVSDSGQDFRPQVATDLAGNWLAAWKSQGGLGGTLGADYDLLISRSTNNGASWGAPTALNIDAVFDGCHDSGPHLATDNSGNWVAAWTRACEVEVPDVFYAGSADNGITWSAPLALTDTGNNGGPQVATDVTGNWMMLWSSYDDLDGTSGHDADILFAQSKNNGMSWTTPGLFNSNATYDTGHDYGSKLVTDRLGHWLSIWESRDDLDGTIGTDADILFAGFWLSDDEPVTICHAQPDDADNTQTITVNESAVPAHLAHGDSCGPCEEDDGAPPGEGGDGEPEASACPADLDGDGVVNASDLAELLAAWGACVAGADCVADIDADGGVGATDLAVLLNNWNSCP